MKTLCVILAVVMLVVGMVAPTVVGAADKWSPRSEPTGPSTGDHVLAGFSSVIYTPGQMAICAGGAVVGAAVMLLTFGLRHDAAAQIVTGTCEGPWVVTGQDIYEETHRSTVRSSGSSR